VYFKEAKQHLGFLKEQSTHYASYIASMHLSAIRFCLLLIAKHEQNASGIPQMRQRIATNLTNLDFAARLWQFFRALISGALDELKVLLGEVADRVMKTIESHVQSFFVQALQLSSRPISLNEVCSIVNMQTLLVNASPHAATT